MKYFSSFGWPIVSALLLTGMTSCIDDKYDLSDIDTTTQIKVKDLVVPVKIKDMTLDKVIDLDEQDPDALIKVREVDGKELYFLSKGGEFDFRSINVDKVYAPKPTFQESTSIIIPSVGTSAGVYKDYDIVTHANQFTYRVGRDGNPRVDGAIESITGVSLSEDSPLRLSLTIESTALGRTASRMELHNLDLKVPEGFTATYGSFTSKNGHLLLPTLSSTTGKIHIPLEVRKISFVSSAVPQGITVTDGMFDFSSEIGFRSGTLRVYPRTGVSTSQLPSTTDFFTRYDLTAFTVDAFSGYINYELDIDGIDAINIDNLPEFLDSDQTNIVLSDAAFTLELNNPVARYGLGCISGITLTPERAGVPSAPCELSQLEVGSDASLQYHVMANSLDALKYIETPAGLTARFTSFTGLDHLLSGQGLPSRINVDFKSAATPHPVAKGVVDEFPLGIDIPRVRGHYSFDVPLAFDSGSLVVYTHTNSGWSDEDVDAINISRLGITANLTSSIPANAKVYIRPIDTEGNRIPLTNADEAFVTLPANASDYAATFELLGDIRNLDGIYIEAVIDNFDGTPLSPDMTIKLTDLKATVTGTYTKEL